MYYALILQKQMIITIIPIITFMDIFHTMPWNDVKGVHIFHNSCQFSLFFSTFEDSIPQFSKTVTTPIYT